MIKPSKKPKVRIGLIRGGNNNREKSIKTGKLFYDLLKDDFDIVDIYKKADNDYIISGLQHDNVTTIAKIDAYFDITYESSTLHDKAKQHKVYAINRHNKNILNESKSYKQLLRFYKANVNNNTLITINKNILSDIHSLVNRFHYPLRVFPYNNHSVSRVANSYFELLNAIEDLTTHDHRFHIEELNVGDDIFVLVIPQFRTKKYYISIPIIQLKDGTFAPLYRAHNKDYDKIIEIVQNAVEAIGQEHHVIVHLIKGRRGITIKDINENYNIDEDDVFLNLINVSGISLNEFVYHVLEKEYKYSNI